MCLCLCDKAISICYLSAIVSSGGTLTHLLSLIFDEQIWNEFSNLNVKKISLEKGAKHASAASGKHF